ncbi:MAG: flagellar hook-length control protein FliK, partial [Halioglobus sp.]|nr:flagellar hook-length control protein FliK [Halioglobus sp.]
DRLPGVADKASAAGAVRKNARDEAEGGFAGVLSAAAPDVSSPESSRGEGLPRGGKQLPAASDDTAVEAVRADADAELDVDSGIALPAVRLPGMGAGLLQGGIPLTRELAAEALSAEVVPDAGSDAELAALQTMLSPQNPVPPADIRTASAEVTVPATIPVLSRDFLPQDRNGLTGGEAGPATLLRRYITRPYGVLTADRALKAGAARSGDAPVAQPFPQPGAGGAGTVPGIAVNVPAAPATDASVLAGSSKEFAAKLRLISEIRMETADGLPRSQPIAGPSMPANGPVPAAPNPGIAAINVPVTDARWGEALADRVMWTAGQKLDSAEIRLNPAELGPVRIKIKIDDKQAQVTFSAHHAVTREAIEQALPRLRELFSGEGLNLANADVNGEGVQHEREHSGSNDSSGRDGLLSDAEPDDQLPLPPLRLSNGLVDTFV